MLQTIIIIALRNAYLSIPLFDPLGKQSEVARDLRHRVLATLDNRHVPDCYLECINQNVPINFMKGFEVCCFEKTRKKKKRSRG